MAPFTVAIASTDLIVAPAALCGLVEQLLSMNAVWALIERDLSMRNGYLDCDYLLKRSLPQLLLPSTSSLRFATLAHNLS